MLQTHSLKYRTLKIEKPSRVAKPLPAQDCPESENRMLEYQKWNVQSMVEPDPKHILFERTLVSLSRCLKQCAFRPLRLF